MIASRGTYIPGQVIGTICTPDWWPPSFQPVACNGIKWWQRRDHELPWSEVTHVGRYLGDGRVFEFTYPRAKWTDVREFTQGKTFFVWDRVVSGEVFHFPEAAVGHMIQAADKILSDGLAKYDVGQLLNHIVLDLFGVPLSRWPRVLDFSARWRVCSSGCAYLEEWARREMVRRAFGLHARGSRYFGLTARHLATEPWPRAFALGDGKYLHTERVKPACHGTHRDYCVAFTNVRTA